jgi:basic amino acid/polyamine antiporter, APA family
MLVFAVLIVGIFLVYWFYGRIRETRENALAHLIQRITAKELTTYSLESELKEIIREHDDIIRDRFDHIIEKAKILDLKQSMHVSEFLELAADVLAKQLNIDAKTIFNLLLSREAEGSTVIAPGMAIPHIVIEGESRFNILLARCRPGIQFHPDQELVQTIFVLVGSRDERNFHLRALSAIAQILQDANFQRKWLAAKNQETLRDAVLLGKRIRKSLN